MEKVLRCNVGRRETDPAEVGDVVNNHSEAIEQHSRVNHGQDESIADLTRRMEAVEYETGGRALRPSGFTYTLPGSIPLPRSRTMTADEAAAILLAEQDKLLAKLRDPKLAVWTRGVVALMVGALREHAREDR